LSCIHRRQRYSSDHLPFSTSTRYFEAMKPIVVVFTVLIAVSAVLHYSAEAAQQCVTCSLTRDCFKATSPTMPCKGKCFKWLLRKNSPDEKPAVIKGCTSDSLFSYRRRCINDCYKRKREFGDGMYYTCIYCCTGDKCNPASQMKGGIILVAVSAALAVGKYLFL